ncbi:MAG: hypothetical protein J6C33_00360 [Lachnospiraceae bacterium]|nr:hypothetical protein [Lachnospiraceae bacterium]
MAGIHYSIRNNRLKKALLYGMEPDADDTICSRGEGVHYALLPVLDSGVEDCPWGRLRFDLILPENCVLYLYAAASNEKEKWEPQLLKDGGLTEKKKVLQRMRGLRFLNKEDVLLYEITGRYLWIMLEAIGGDVSVGHIRAEAPGDNFMQTFPEVYREKNSFFHRYLSIYSSIYNDFQEKLDERGELLPVETAPMPLLELYAKWLGIDAGGGYLGEETLRELLKEAPELLRRKGTQYCIVRICEILLGETPTIAERGRMQPFVRGSQRELYDRLYGESPYDVTLLFEHYAEEKKKEQLLHLLAQFKPVRTRLHITFLGAAGMLDEHSYLNQNAVIFTQKEGCLDMAQTADGTIILQ